MLRHRGTLPLLLVPLVACDERFVFVPPVPPPVPVASVILEPSTAVIGPGDSLRLQVTLRGAGDSILTGRAVTFASTDVTRATVSGDGLVRGVAFGAAWIVASAEGQADTTVIHVARFTITDVSPGGNHTCGAMPDGVACWGYNRYGQTGIGQTGPTVVIPTRVLELGAALPVAGGNHTCVRQGGSVLCWGWNQSGQLGNGTPGDASLPVEVTTASPLVVLTAGGQHTCGLAEQGVALCWGLNADGQIGDTTFQNQARPVVVAGGLSFTTISAGGRHTCAVATDSLAYCWGANEFGQLGDGTAIRRGRPTPVAGGHRFKAIAAGRFHSCALTASGVGTAFCWGLNARRQLGTGTGGAPALAPVLVDGGRSFNVVTTGGMHTCALEEAGAAFCWGYNEWGQVGDSSTRDAGAPTPVRTTERFVSLRTFGDHTCGMTTTARAFCWGLGWTGELGTGTLANSAFPVRVAGQP